MTSVGIVGGGISGLVGCMAAFAVRHPVHLYESSNRLGGMIGSFRRDGFLVEHGPNTILETSPRIPELISALGIESRRVFPNAEAKRRYIVKERQAACAAAIVCGVCSDAVVVVLWGRRGWHWSR